MLERIDIEERRLEVAHLSDFGTTILRHPDAAGLFGLWLDLKGERAAPFRAELDAGRIGAKAPFLAILEYVSPSNFRVRIAGDRLNKWYGMELRGMSAMALVAPEARNHLQGALNRVTAEPAAAAVQGVARRADGLSAPFDMALLPMRSDFGRIDRVLVGIWLIDAPAATSGPLRFDAEGFVVSPVFATPEQEPETLAVEETAAEPARLDAPSLRTIDGGGESKGAGRRGHLRLVKKH